MSALVLQPRAATPPGASMDWLSQGLLPFGFVMFFGMLLAFLRRQTGHRSAARDFPALAKELGLTYRASNHKRTIGGISGKLSGFWVTIDPDDTKRISLRFEEKTQIEFKSYLSQRPAPHGWPRFSSGDRRFDRFFKTRYAGEATARRLSSAGQLWEVIEPLVELGRPLKQVSITDEGMSAVFDFGNPPYIPAKAAKIALLSMVALAGKISAPVPTRG